MRSAVHAGREMPGDHREKTVREVGDAAGRTMADVRAIEWDMIGGVSWMRKMKHAGGSLQRVDRVEVFLA